jgi:catechol 2,3-dioxygenase-like lactoylglutathione lyase family enzyme
VASITFDHCVIHVAEWERSIAFCRDVLGAEIVPYGRGAMFRFGPVQLNIHGPGQIGTPRAGLPVMPGGSDICFEWHGPIEDAIRHLDQHSVKVEVGPVDRIGARGQGRSVYFRDPDGSFLEFITYRRD